MPAKAEHEGNEREQEQTLTAHDHLGCEPTESLPDVIEPVQCVDEDQRRRARKEKPVPCERAPAPLSQSGPAVTCCLGTARTHPGVIMSEPAACHWVLLPPCEDPETVGVGRAGTFP